MSDQRKLSRMKFPRKRGLTDYEVELERVVRELRQEIIELKRGDKNVQML